MNPHADSVSLQQIGVISGASDGVRADLPRPPPAIALAPGAGCMAADWKVGERDLMKPPPGMNAGVIVWSQPLGGLPGADGSPVSVCGT